MLTKQETAAIIIQSYIRGFFARKLYKLVHLPPAQLQYYPVMVQGNDPEVANLSPIQNNERIAIVGTSGMRSVEIACKLSSKRCKIIIIDNSLQVTKYWRDMQKLLDKTTNKLTFLSSFETYYQAHPAISRKQTNSHLDFNYFDYLFTSYGFEQVKQLICHAVVIRQSWGHQDTFATLKNVFTYCHYDKIYAYPSNIVAYSCFHNKLDLAYCVLKNIAYLNPTLAIHANMTTDGYSRQIYFFKNHTPDRILNKIGIKQQWPALFSSSTQPAVDIKQNNVIKRPHAFFQDFNDWSKNDQTSRRKKQCRLIATT